MSEPIKLLTISEIAQALSVSVGAVRWWVSREEIPYVKVGRHLRFDLTEVLQFYRDRSQESQRACLSRTLQAERRARNSSLTTRRAGRAGGLGEEF